MNGNLFIVKKTRGKLSPFGEIRDSKRLAEVNLEHLNLSLVFSAVRACFHYYLEKKGGFALHASCGVAGGDAYIFTGKPSAGKTTALKNLAPDRVVAQDCLAIARRNNRYMAFSLPFFGERSAKGRVKAVFFPKRTTGSPRLERETLPKTFAEISANAMFSSPQNPRLIDSALENVNKFCAEIPAFSLFSLKRTDVRKLFSENGI